MKKEEFAEEHRKICGRNGRANETLKKLHAIEEKKIIYNIHYCRAGVGFNFYYPEKDIKDDKESWRKALSVEKYHPSFEEAVDAEYTRLIMLEETI